MIVSHLKEISTGSQFTILADEGTEDEVVYTMLDPRTAEGETEIGPLVNVTHDGLLAGHLVLRDVWGPARIIAESIA